jgi:hypothetical protein
MVGGLEHEFYDFPYIGNHHPNSLIFFKMVKTANQYYTVYLPTFWDDDG